MKNKSLTKLSSEDPIINLIIKNAQDAKSLTNNIIYNIDLCTKLTIESVKKNPALMKALEGRNTVGDHEVMILTQYAIAAAEPIKKQFSNIFAGLDSVEGTIETNFKTAYDEIINVSSDFSEALKDPALAKFRSIFTNEMVGANSYIVYLGNTIKTILSAFSQKLTSHAFSEYNSAKKIILKNQ